QGSPGDYQGLGAVRNRRADHRPQRARNAERNRSRIHTESWENNGDGYAAVSQRGHRGSPRVPGRSFPAQLAPLGQSAYGLAGTQAQSESGAEADSDARPGADGERAGAEPARAQGNDQPGDDCKPDPMGAKWRECP